ncbi:alpha amylase C-terminal domain-containing protein [Blastopirellula retiformator]|uniref:1,4-alpha-glucan branching enzyme n=1 Tax=Blastopirellula retiformator TaxID=2527970 RepID=A0A5C5V195_9BACT|nr:alpha amylase C-terminal domain-containing protein [Blastopirellula retiformator]TWT31710.1 1,4-alpha-glucan branching enzyme GlgB [Blastopirellula retiformator]
MLIEDPIDPNSLPMGANMVADKSGATFRCWAPRAKGVYLRGSFDGWVDGWKEPPPAEAKLFRHGDYWACFVPNAKDGDHYKFWVDGEGSSGWKRDPYAREFTRNWPDSDCILRDPDAFVWHDGDYLPPAFNDLIIYQLHVGVFNGPNRPSRVAKFFDLLGKLDYLKALGINAVKLLPVVEFKNSRSLGYEGTDIFSPEMDYTVPPNEFATYLPLVNGLRNRHGLPSLVEQDLESQCDQLKIVIELFHLNGIAVLLDVVYNHAGGKVKDDPQSLYFFDRAAGVNPNDSLYFTDQDHTGPVWAIWKSEVRQFLIDNAVFFINEYHFDGFRYDQVSVIVDQNSNDGWKFCQDLTNTVRFTDPSAVQIAEFWGVDPFVVRFPEHGGAGFDASWHDGIRTSVRDAVHSASFGASSQLDLDRVRNNLWAPGFLNAWRAVQYLESHDEVYRDRNARVPQLADGNSARSWHARSRSRAAAGLLLTSPGIPMIFMGQSFLEDKRWADDAGNHADLLIWWEGLDFGRDPHMGRFHRFFEELVWLRRNEPALRSETLNPFHTNAGDRVLAFHRWVPGVGRDAVVVVSFNDVEFSGYELGFPHAGHWREIFNSDAYDDYTPRGNGGGIEAFGGHRDGLNATARITIPPNSVLVFGG